LAKAKPGGQRNVDDTFIGRAGQLADIAELLRHRCNAAIPEVDLGTCSPSRTTARKSSAFK
jgi:hypothetical protein